MKPSQKLAKTFLFSKLAKHLKTTKLAKILEKTKTRQKHVKTRNYLRSKIKNTKAYETLPKRDLDS